MNLGWAFHRGDIVNGEYLDLDDSGWIATTLPHIMQLEKKHCGGDIIYDGIGWYRRTFKIPSQYKDKKISISFEGVMNACEVFLNGQKYILTGADILVLWQISLPILIGIKIIC